MKISIIMCVKNSMPYIVASIKSFEKQSYKNKELIIIRSKSEDTTDQYLNNINNKNIKIYNYEGQIYKALNYGIKKAGGNIIGILHSDDVFFDKNVLSNITNIFKKNKKIDFVYSNILYSERNNLKNVKRIWKNIDINNKHELPPHTGSFVHKKIYNKLKYNTKYKISSDTEFLIKIKNLKLKIYYFKNYTVIMRIGGISTNFKGFIRKVFEDMIIFREKKLGNILYLKKIFYKLGQIFYKKNIIFSKYHGNLNNLSKIKIVNIKKIEETHGKIISALNLAFISYNSKFGLQSAYNFFWPDGIFSKTISKEKKIAGRIFFTKYLKYINKKPKKFNQIYIVGNINKTSKEWLNKNILQKFIFHSLKFGNISEIISSYKKTNYKKNSLIILTIPTPKQEILANYIKSKDKNVTIICIGGSINILSGFEKRTPELLNKLNLEWFWRLRFDTIRRTTRLIETSYLFLKMLILNNNKIH